MDDERERLIYALIHKDEMDTAKQNAIDWAEFIAKKREYAQQYGKDRAATLLAQEEKIVLAQMNTRTQTQKGLEQERWERHHSNEPQPEQKPPRQERAETREKTTQQREREQTPKQTTQQDKDFERIAALLERGRKQREDREKGRDRDGLEY